MKEMELLSPAGSMEAVKAAVTNGADAIYLGTKLFNARRLAHNFTDVTLPKAILYCKLHGVRVYLTVNTLVRNQELKLWFEHIKKAYLWGIDAVIVQEVSLVNLLKKHFPGLEVHASTQASFMNYHGIQALPDFDLYVLARELKKEEVKEIRKRISKKLEVFVHGHLCVSYSGQCLISSLIGSRSGNRGICASSCRKKYNNKGYLISPRDLMMGNNVGDLYELGINSLKIEGRMKSPEYVAITTRTYRKQMDDTMKHKLKKLSKKEIDNLRMGFNRDFTPGFLTRNNIVDAEMPMNRGILLGTITNGELVLEHAIQLEDGVSFWQGKGQLTGGSINQILINSIKVDKAKKGDKVVLPFREFRNGVKVFLTSQNEGQKVEGTYATTFPVTVTGEVGSPLVISDKEGRFSISSTIPLEQAKNQALQKETVGKKLNQILPTTITSFDVDDVFLPMTVLNEMIGKYDTEVKKILLPKREDKPILLPTFNENSFDKAELLVKVYSLEQLKEALTCGVKVIYYDVFADNLVKVKELCKKHNTTLFLDTPVILNDKHINSIQHILDTIKPDGITIGNWGLLDINFKGEKHGKYSLNTFNDIDMNMLLEKGITPLFSIELNYKQLSRFKLKKGIYYTHGRIPVMHFKGEYKEKSLTDEKGYTFPLRHVGGNTEMLYSRPIATFERIKELQQIGINHFFLDLEKDTTTIIKAYQNILNGIKQDISFLKKGTTIKNFEKGVA